jgi:hypothetical protein
VGDGLEGKVAGAGEPMEEGLREAIGAEGVGLAGGGVEVIAEGEEGKERGGGRFPEQGKGGGEAATIGDEIPVTGEAAEALDGGEIEVAIGEQFVRWVGIVAHGPFLVVTLDGSAAEALEQAHLDFLGIQADQTIETGGKTVEGFAGQADDEVGVEVDTGLLAEEAEIILQPIEVLASGDAGADIGMEGLDADFELEGAGGEGGDFLAERFREAVGDHFEVEEEAVVPAIAEEAEDGTAGGEVEVEGAIDELEMPGAALEESVHGGEERFQGKGTDGEVEGGQAELAGEGATTGGFHVEDAMGEVVIGIELVGEGELGEVGEGGGDDAGKGGGKGRIGGRGVGRRGKQGSAQMGEGQVSFAGEGMIGEGDDLLLIGFVADLGAAEDDDEVGLEAFEEGHDLLGLADVPDIDAEADDAGLLGEDGFDDVGGVLLEIELEEGGARLKIGEIGVEVAQAEGGMNIAGIEGGEDDLGHGKGREEGGWEGDGRKGREEKDGGGGENRILIRVSEWRG